MIRDELSKAIAKAFGEKLKDARIEYGVLQKEMGELLDRYQNYSWELEAGRRFPTKRDLSVLCDYFNKTPEYFFPDGVPELMEDIEKRPYSRKDKKHPALTSQKNIGIPLEHEKDINYDVEQEYGEVAIDIQEEEPPVKQDPIEVTPTSQKEISIPKNPVFKNMEIEVPVGDKMLKIKLTFE